MAPAVQLPLTSLEGYVPAVDFLPPIGSGPDFDLGYPSLDVSSLDPSLDPAGVPPLDPPLDPTVFSEFDPSLDPPLDPLLKSAILEFLYSSQSSPKTTRGLTISQTRRIRDPVTGVIRTGIPRIRYSTTYSRKTSAGGRIRQSLQEVRERLPKELNEFTEDFCKRNSNQQDENRMIRQYG
jgi:hypothetical protein